MAKAKKKRDPLDNLADHVHDLLDSLERLLQPEPKREPARIPIPVRDDIPHPRRRRRR